ncbi:MAG: hypothetical protein CMJ18_07625 [Phycisphaeraceae bacterium]|nr:hypothetical protein [Phycisphaeraceae bacterium]
MPPPPEDSSPGRRKREPREQISAGLRFDILRRCNFACYYCGVPASLGLKVLHVDHVIPVSLGGTNDPWNLVAACWDCNLGKAGLPPTRELVNQVRDDFCAYPSPREARIDQCRYCRMPIEVFEDEDYDGQCVTCNELMCDSYDQALIRHGLLKRGGGGDVV